jgi:hypothetical protein
MKTLLILAGGVFIGIQIHIWIVMKAVKNNHDVGTQWREEDKWNNYKDPMF